MADRQHPWIKFQGNPSPVPHEMIARAKPIEDANPTSDMANTPHTGGTVLGAPRGESWPPHTEKNVGEIDGKPTVENLHLWGRYASWSSPMSWNSPRHRR